MTTEKPKDGGPAFPVEVDDEGAGLQTSSFSGWATGMSLRDYFAGQALTGILRAVSGAREPIGVAELAYKMADAMLAEREKP